MAEEVGGLSAPCDVSDRDALRAAVELCERECGPVDLLVANHAFMTMAPFLESSEADFARTLEVNLLGTAWLIAACAPAMASRGYGRIVAIASEWGVIGWPNATSYAASKGGIIALVKSAARRYARDGVAVNAVAPGVTDTPQLDVDAADAGLTHEEMVAGVRPGRPARADRAPIGCRGHRGVPALSAGGRVRGPGGRPERRLDPGMKRMERRVAVVTGASSGIGRACALALAEEGAAVALVALPGSELDEAAKACRALGASVVGVGADVRHSADVDRAFAAADELGPVDAVFNNAGISMVVSITETTDEQWERLVGTNLSGNFYVARAAARAMVPRRRGAIVNTASELALIGEAGYAAYTATKGGILSMTRALAAELAPYGVRVNAVCPGATDTPLLRAEYDTAPDPGAARAEGEGSIALGRLGQPEDIARVVVFLLSDEAAYVTGSHYVVDGGRTTCIPTGVLTPETDGS